MKRSAEAIRLQLTERGERLQADMDRDGLSLGTVLEQPKEISVKVQKHRRHAGSFRPDLDAV